jgi:hypothetical protein
VLSVQVKRTAVLVLQVAVSLAILGLLVWDARTEELHLSFGVWRWDMVSLALAMKSGALVLHEYRLWLALPAPRPHLRRTMVIGFISGAMHTVLPARGGDAVAFGLLKQQLGVRAGTAAYAVGMAAFFEAAAFGAMVLFALAYSAPAWQDAADVHARAIHWVTAATLGGTLALVAAGIAGRRLAEEPEPSEEGFSLRTFLTDGLRQTGRGTADRRYLLLNLAISAIEVWLMVEAFAIGLEAVGIQSQTPWTVSALILGISAVAAVALPPTYGAGPAAAAVFILSLFGISQEAALSYSALWWLISQLPAAAFGLPCLWLLKRPPGKKKKEAQEERG